MHKSLPTDRGVGSFALPVGGRSRGFGTIELLVALRVTAIGIALASGLMLAGKTHIHQQDKELEATQAGRAALDTILRELRLGGACLPETGAFIALEAIDAGKQDEVVTRHGLTTSDLSCIQTASAANVAAAATALPVDDTSGFEVGQLVYLRHTDGSGEYFKVASVDVANHILGTDRGLSKSYPATSGLYAIDERRFYIDSTTPSAPCLMFQVGSEAPQPFALGIEALDIGYELANGTVLDQPSTDREWRSVRNARVSLTSRSVEADPDGTYYRRTYDVEVKPRNLVDS